MKFASLALAVPLLLSGCVSLKATKATSIAGNPICIIDNPEVNTDFRAAYENQLHSKGYATKIIADGTTCVITSTYKAAYGFHWGMYLASAEIKIFNQGIEIGNAVYSAPFASPAKHGRVEGKIEAMVAKMLP